MEDENPVEREKAAEFAGASTLAQVPSLPVTVQHTNETLPGVIDPLTDVASRADTCYPNRDENAPNPPPTFSISTVQTNIARPGGESSDHEEFFVEVHEGDKTIKKDRYGNAVEMIFHESPGRFAIYQTTDELIHMTGDVSALSNSPELQRLMSAMACFTVTVPKLRKMYNSSYAYGLRLLLDGDRDGGLAAINVVLLNIERSLRRWSNLAYLSGAFMTLAVTLLIYAGCYESNILGDLGVSILNSLTLAAMGGIMSVSIGIKDIKIDLLERTEVNIFYGFQRIVIAMIAGVITLFILDSRIALAFLREPGTGSPPGSNHGYLVAAFFSGFSEMFVPNVMKQIESGRGNQTTDNVPEDHAHANP